MEQLSIRVAKFAAGTEPLIASAKKAHLLDQDNSWPTLKWNPELKKQVPIPGQSIPMAKMVKQLEFLLESSKQEDLVIAFQAMYAETAAESKPVASGSACATTNIGFASSPCSNQVSGA